MRKQKRVSLYVSVLAVYAPGAVALLDMMRYDSCVLEGSVDAGKVETLIRRGRDITQADHLVRLRRYSMSSGSATTERWRSFGCVVLDERSPDDAPLTDDKLVELALHAGVVK